MKGQNFKFEKFLVMETVGLPFHGFDLVIGPFGQWKSDNHNRPGYLDYEDHGPAFQVQDYGQIAVPFADADFIDGDLLELMQLGMGKASQREKTSCRTRKWIAPS